MRRRPTVPSLALALALAACGGDGSRGGTDAGVDVGSDAAVDAASDAGVDAGIDAGRDGGHPPPDAAGEDAATDAGADASADAGSDAGPDAGEDAGTDAGDPTCLTSFRCEAETADTECGVLTSDGRRYPDAGAPYCSDVLTRAGCTCDLLRCTSPLPLCPGTYTARFRERMISGCNGVPGELSGTCDSLWNVVERDADGALLAERNLFNVYLSFDWADYDHEVVITEPTVVRLRVEQDAWLEDVSGVGNAGRSEVDWAEIALPL